jgi:hypothetical protein
VPEVTNPPAAEGDPARDATALLQMIHAYWMSQILRAAADLSVMDHVAAGADTAGQVAAKESSDPRTTYRLMRALASLGLLGYAGDGRFEVTPMGGLLRAGVPGSLRNLALAIAGPGHWKMWERLPEAVRAGTTQAEAALGMPVWDYLQKESPQEGALFSAAMAELTQMVIADVLAVADLSGVSVAADVGGADGSLVRAFMQASPALRGIVLDRPEIVPAAIEAAKKDGLSGRFTGQAGDFFEEVPAADLYLLKLVLHDWDDEACLSLLRNCRASARPGARALVIEIVLGEPGTPGVGPLHDMNMLAGNAGGERELTEYDALFAASGWRRTALHETRGIHSVIELAAV